MTNGEKYKTAQERAEACKEFMKDHKEYDEMPYIDAAFHWLDLEAEEESFEDVVEEMRNRMIDREHSPSLWPFVDRLVAAHNRVAKDAEIERLKAALKPVMECRIERIDGLDSPDGEFMTSSDYGVCDADGNEVDSHSIASALNAVREAQRIYKEGGAK